MKIRWRWARKQAQDVAMISGLGRRGALSVSSPSGKKAVSLGIQADPVVWAGIDALATALIRPRATVNDDENHPLAQRLNQRANDIEDGWQFRYRHALQFITSPNGVFTLVEPEFKSLTLLDPTTVMPVIEEGKLKGYFHAESSQLIDPELVCWHRKPHPYDLVASLTPMTAAGLAIDTSREVLAFMRRWVANDGGVRMLLAFNEPTLADDDLEYIIRRLQPQANVEEKTGTLSAVKGTGVQAVNLAGDTRANEYDRLRDSLTDDILLALRTPRSVAGDASGRTYANAATEQAIWWEWTVEPMLAFLAAGWQTLLREEEKFRWAKADIPAVQRVQEERASGLVKLVVSDIMSIDEARERLGLEPQQSDIPETVEQSVKRRVWESIPPDLYQTFEGRQTVRLEQLTNSMLKRLRPAMRKVRNEIMQYYERWGPEGFTRVARDLLSEADLVAEIAEILGEELVGALLDLVKEVAKSWANAYNNGIPQASAKDVERIVRQRAVPLVDLRASERGVPLPQQIIDDVREVVSEGVTEGLGSREIGNRIEEVLDGWEGWELERIARTEVHSAANLAELAEARASDVVVAKTWLPVGDDRTRETHMNVDPDTVGVNEMFIVGGYETDVPGNTGAPEEDINCRCTILWRTIDEMGEEFDLEAAMLRRIKSLG